jgi:hypothetical protein
MKMLISLRNENNGSYISVQPALKPNAASITVTSMVSLYQLSEGVTRQGFNEAATAA